MRTEVLKINPRYIELSKIKKAARIIKLGGIVAIPTETVYGLAADFFNRRAQEQIYKIKKRPKNKLLPVQIGDISYLDDLNCEVSVFAYNLMSAFWPGPLTLVMNRRGRTFWRKNTIGVRIPENRIALSLLKASQRPLVVPSANMSGQAPVCSAEEVLDIFDGIVDMVIDGGVTQSKIASTVLDITGRQWKILRPGLITKRAIRRVQG